MKRHKTWDVKPVFPNEHDAKFFDSYGTPVDHGTEIIIEQNYNYHFNNGRPAVVEWDKQRGMYKYRFTDGKSQSMLSDFHGIHSFKVKPDQNEK